MMSKPVVPVQHHHGKERPGTVLSHALLSKLFEGYHVRNQAWPTPLQVCVDGTPLAHTYLLAVAHHRHHCRTRPAGLQGQPCWQSVTHRQQLLDNTATLAMAM
jgi:hypothetical protein